MEEAGQTPGMTVMPSCASSVDEPQPEAEDAAVDVVSSGLQSTTTLPCYTAPWPVAL